MAKRCTYFLVPISPYVYLGHERFTALAQKHGVEVELKPMDIAKVFNESGGLPLAKRAPQRQHYRLVELKRWSEHLGLPMNLHPKHFPNSSDPAARAIIAAQKLHGVEAAMQLVKQITRGVWADERDIADAATLESMATHAGMNGAALLAAAAAPEIQAEYEANTAAAIEAEVFGAPWYVFNGEPFWGQDRLEFLERAFAKT